MGLIRPLAAPNNNGTYTSLPRTDIIGVSRNQDFGLQLNLTPNTFVIINTRTNKPLNMEQLKADREVDITIYFKTEDKSPKRYLIIFTD